MKFEWLHRVRNRLNGWRKRHVRDIVIVLCMLAVCFLVVGIFWGVHGFVTPKTEKVLKVEERQARPTIHINDRPFGNWHVVERKRVYLKGSEPFYTEVPFRDIRGNDAFIVESGPELALKLPWVRKGVGTEKDRMVNANGFVHSTPAILERKKVIVSADIFPVKDGWLGALVGALGDSLSYDEDGKPVIKNRVGPIFIGRAQVFSVHVPAKAMYLTTNTQQLARYYDALEGGYWVDIVQKRRWQ